MKHALFKSKEEHWVWCYENYFKYYGNFNPSPWSDEDKKILQPFFDYSDTRKEKHAQMSPEVQAAFEYYDKVRDKGMFARECIDVVQRIEESQLLEVFGFERKYESDFETDEEYEAYLDNEEPPELAIELSYPCIMVSSLSASFDRCGDVTEVIVDYVSLEEFKE